MFKRQEETPSASYGYWTVERVFPGSFTTPEHFDFDNPNEGDEYAFIYYSFVTLTTLGYGEFTPTNDVSQSFAWIGAVVGAFHRHPDRPSRGHLRRTHGPRGSRE